MGLLAFTKEVPDLKGLRDRAAIASMGYTGCGAT
jgi:hypothetical protein